MGQRPNVISYTCCATRPVPPTLSLSPVWRFAPADARPGRPTPGDAPEQSLTLTGTDINLTTTVAYTSSSYHRGLLPRPADAFSDEAESDFYAQGVQAFLLGDTKGRPPERPVMELGSGTGEAIAEILESNRFAGEIVGYELQAQTCAYARQVIADRGISRYRVVQGDFFDAVPDTDLECAISNPPYLPALDDRITVPELWGGLDGSAVVRRLLGCGFSTMVTTLSSFANPVRTIEFATDHGYRVADFAVRTISFGAYSSEPKVREQIERMALRGRGAFVTADRYCLAVVLWIRVNGANLAGNLRAAVTSLR